MTTNAPARRIGRQRRMSVGHLVWRGLIVGIVLFWCLFLLMPVIVALAVSVTTTEYAIFPPRGFTLRWYQVAWESAWFTNSVVTSGAVATLATIVSLAGGTLAAYVICRSGVRGRAVFEYLMMTPLIVPSVTIGFAIFNTALLLGTQNWSFLNLVLGHAVITLPLTLRSVSASMLGLNSHIEEAAQSLGATPWLTFWKVILPSILPGLIGAAIIAFTFSFNDVAVAAFLNGPTTRTLPVELMAQIEYLADPSPAAITSMVILFTLVVFFVVDRTVGLDVFAPK